MNDNSLCIYLTYDPYTYSTNQITIHSSVVSDDNLLKFLLWKQDVNRAAEVRSLFILLFLLFMIFILTVFIRFSNDFAAFSYFQEMA